MWLKPPSLLPYPYQEPPSILFNLRPWTQAAGARQQQSPLTNFEVANLSSIRDAVPSGPRRYPIRPRHSPDRYGTFVSH